MEVFRIEKTRDYTMMSNHHLRNMRLSLKSKGLLSMGPSKNLQGGYGQHRLRPEGAGTSRVHSPQPAAGQQGQDRGCRVCHLRDALSSGHGPAV